MTPHAEAPKLASEAELQASRAAIKEWIDRPGFERLLRLFGGSANDETLGRVSDSVRRHGAWALGGELPGAFIDQASARDVVLRRLIGLEEFASFCWNFRSGMPRAVLHLLAESAGRSALSEHLPALAVDTRWSGADGLDLLGVYFGTAVEDVATSLADAATVYPNVSETGYRERWQAADLPFPAHVREAVHSAADDLGLVTPGRPTGHYDHVVVLGGGGTSPWIRAHYAAELIQTHALSPTGIWMLGSPRPIDENAERGLIHKLVEREPLAAGRYLTATRDEFDLMAVAAEAAFGVAAAFNEMNVCGCTDVLARCPRWQAAHEISDQARVARTDPRFQHQRHRRYATRSGPHVHVLSASTGRPPDRPNTADTYALLADVAGLGKGQRALIITTQVFVPFQRFDAIRMLQLPTGLDIDVVGFGAERGDRPSTPEFELQEVLSGLRSARRLADSLT